MRILNFLCASALLLGFAYCKSTKTTTATTTTEPKKAELAYIPSEKQLQIAQTRWAGTTAEDISQGQIVYTTKCVSCHMLYDIMEFSEKKWIHEIAKMSPKANLTQEETAKLTKHILSFREANAPVKSN